MPGVCESTRLSGNGVPARGVVPREVALWVLAAVVLLALGLHFHGLRVFNDSYHYLSEAENIRAGNGFTTSIIHYDVERRTGRVPAPMTTYPFGYPLLIAAANVAGLPFETGAVLWSGLAYLGLVLLVWTGARLLEFGPVSTRIALAATVLSSWGLLWGVSMMTEALFTAVSTAAVLLIVRHEKAALSSPPRYRPGLLLAANLLVVAAYTIRYAGLFLFLALLLYFGARYLFARTADNLRSIALAGVSGAIIGALIWRNILITGTWRGGNDKEIYEGVAFMASRLVVSLYGLLVGGATSTLIQAAVAASGLLLLVAVALLWRSRSSLGAPRLLFFPCLYLAVYSAAMVYTGAFTVIQLNPRYLYPLLPLLALVGVKLAATAWPGLPSKPARLAFTAAVALFLAACGSGNLLRMFQPYFKPFHVQIAPWMDEPTPSGESMREWIERHADPGEILAATRGNATSYLLRRPILSLASQSTSSQVWDEEAVRSAMDAYGARFLILYPTLYQIEYEQAPLFSEVLAGRVPAWLGVATRTPNIVVLEVRTPSSGPQRQSSARPPGFAGLGR
ncbi:MAG: hypothetical protein KIT09_05075 [Bryobacteraceae bacterium]|nr:hypothetical protein [Bryobacteraceae bacterium]